MWYWFIFKISTTQYHVIFVDSRTSNSNHNGNDKNNNTNLETRGTADLADEDYQNIAHPSDITETETYLGLDPTSRQPEPMYQGVTNPSDLKSADNYLSLDPSSRCHAEDVYEDLKEKEHSSDTVYVIKDQGLVNNADQVKEKNLEDSEPGSRPERIKALQVPTPPKIEFISNDEHMNYVNAKNKS